MVSLIIVVKNALKWRRKTLSGQLTWEGRMSASDDGRLRTKFVGEVSDSLEKHWLQY